MSEQLYSESNLTPGAARLVDTAIAHQRSRQHDELGSNHWLLALVERHAPMAQAFVPEIDAAALSRTLVQRLDQREIGEPAPADEVVRRAVERAAARGKPQTYERDLAAIVLMVAGYPVASDAESPAAQPRAAAQAPVTSGPSTMPRDPGGAVTMLDTPSTQEARPESTSGETYRVRPQKPTPALDQFGRDLTRQAVEGRLSGVLGREEEMSLAVETLCRRTKRNPALIGPAGVGKTAIVEGLAQRIVRGAVPETLRGARIIALQPSTLVAGAGVVGELERRVKAILGEAAQDGLIVFIDEFHSMIGAGGREGSSDMASLLKPALARGDIACIAATTDEEYRRYVEPDPALERRFQPIRVQELTVEQTLPVVANLRDELSRLRGVSIPDEVIKWLVDFAARFLRNRYFPDKAVDLLEQCVAHAVARGKPAVDQLDADAVARRIVGMPLAPGERVAALRARLAAQPLLIDADTRTLLSRLEVTTRSLDLRPARPNAVVLLVDEAASQADALAAAAAKELFGAEDRVVTIDFGRFVTPADLTMLVGAPPGYIGYSESLPIHRIAQIPWCVLLCENVHACHPQAQAVLSQTLEDGFMTDARGRRIYLSDVVVLLTASGVSSEARKTVGFQQSPARAVKTSREAVRALLGAELTSQIDLICSARPAAEGASRQWVKEALLANVAAQYGRHGLVLSWDDTLIDWLASQHEALTAKEDWERFVDERLSPYLAPHVQPGGARRAVLVKWADGAVTTVDDSA